MEIVSPQVPEMPAPLAPADPPRLPPAPDSRHSIFTMGVLGAVGIIISLLFNPLQMPAWELCRFKSMTGLPCPGCGLTRACVNIAHGRWAAAWEFNPFGYIVFALMVVAAVFALLVYFYPAAQRWYPSSRLISWCVGIFLAGLITFGALRLAGFTPQADWMTTHGGSQSQAALEHWAVLLRAATQSSPASPHH